MKPAAGQPREFIQTGVNEGIADYGMFAKLKTASSFAAAAKKIGKNGNGERLAKAFGEVVGRIARENTLG